MTIDIGYEVDNVYVGNNVEMMAVMPDDCIDLTVTSPPYDDLREYEGFVLDWQEVLRQLYRVTKPGGVVVWVVADATVDGSESGTSFEQALWAKNECGFNIHDTMVYAKTGVGSSGSNLAYPQAWEFMFVFTKGKIATVNHIRDVVNPGAGKIRRYAKKRSDKSGYIMETVEKMVEKYTKRDNIWHYDIGFTNKSESMGHPAVFPEQLAKDHIVSWSNPGDVVLDPFMGSGTTAKAAKELGRHYIGFDISEEYVKIARQRLEWTNPPLLVV